MTIKISKKPTQLEILNKLLLTLDKSSKILYNQVIKDLIGHVKITLAEHVKLKTKV